MRLIRAPSERACAPRRSSAWAGFALALVLLAAQTLGLWHRTQHAPATGPDIVNSHDGHRASIASEAGHDSLTGRVFGHSAGESSSCRLFDQQTLADSLLTVAAVLPVFEPARAGGVPIVETVARPASAPYQARAPPSVG